MDMLSRVADSLYWMSRYLERAEHTARVLEVFESEQLEDFEEGGTPRWRTLVDSVGLEPPAGLTEETVGYWLAFDISNQSSIVACVMSARDNARQVREQISSEMWEHLNRLFHRVRSVSQSAEWSPDQHGYLTEVKEGAHLFQGITDSTMNHGEGWQFIQLGRFIERAVSVGSLIDVAFRDHAPGVGAGIALLKSCTAFEAYCKVYTADVTPLRIAEFLLLNPEFPHSVCFAIDQVEVALKALPQLPDRRIGGRALRLAGKLKATLSFGQMDEILANGLHAFLKDIDSQCAQIHSAVHQIYIEYPIASAIEA